MKYLHCGLGQFSLHYGRALLAGCPQGWQPVFLLPKRAEENFMQLPAQPLTATPWRKENVQRWVRPVARFSSRQPAYQLWHVTHQDSSYWPLDDRIPVILTIHDLNFLRTKSPRVIGRRLQVLQGKIDRATILTTGSQHAATEIREHFDLRGESIRVIPHGVCLDATAAPVRPAGIPQDARFLFTIGDIRPSKNFHVLVDMLSHLPGFTLIIAGSTKDPYASLIIERARKLGLSDRVLLPGRISEGERLWLYQHCEALVFPSLAEGFGLPLIEAMHCGRPVFSSRCTSLPEVGGPWTFYWDNFSADEMAATLHDGLDRFAADREYPDRLRAWARQFTWEQVAKRYFQLFEEVLSDRGSALLSAA
jgi:glycosyltransferase involved in cell wall biosynthesis